MISSNSNSEDQQQSHGWWQQLKTLNPQWRLVTCDGSKRPIDPSTGLPLPDWGRKSISPSEFLKLPRSGIKAAGVVLGPASGGLLAIDFDAEGYQEKFELTYGRPLSDLPPTVAWTSGKPGRRQLAFVVPQHYWNCLRGRKTWSNQKGQTCLELRWIGHQSVILGAHPETEGYRWCNACSPSEVKVAAAPQWLLQPLMKTLNDTRNSFNDESLDPDECQRARELLKQVSPRDDYDGWLKVGMILRGVDESLLDDWIEWSRQTDSFNEGECINKWNSFNGSGLTLGTLSYMAAQDAGGSITYNRLTSTDSSRSNHDEGLSIQDSLNELIRLYTQSRINARELLPPYLRDALSVIRETLSYDWSVLLLVLCVGISGALPLESVIELIPGDFEQGLNLFAVLLMDTGEAKSPLIQRLIAIPWRKSVDMVMKARYLETCANGSY